MAELTDYASLTSAISDWDVRSWTAAETDQFIRLAEAEFRLYFGPNFAMESSTALTFADGVASLPSGFLRAIDLSHATYGPMQQVSWAALARLNPLGQAGVPTHFAVGGSSIKTADLFDGDATLTYEGTLTGLSSANTTNWLITNAPQAYLSMCLSMAKAKMEVFDAAALYRQQALQTLADLGIQSMVAQSSRGTVTLPGATP